MSNTLNSIAGHCADLDMAFVGDDRPVHIYFLIVSDEIMYIGQTTSLQGRVVIQEGRRPDRVMYLVVRSIDADAYEGALIRRLNTPWCRRAPVSDDRDAEILAVFGIEPDACAANEFYGRARREWREVNRGLSPARGSIGARLIRLAAAR